jgi:cytoskeletal protein CcmA (bactofilin family)
VNTAPAAHPHTPSGTIERGSDRPSPALAESTGVVLVPAGGVFEGQIAIMGQTCIEGTVRGSLCGTGELELGREASVEGKVECDILRSRGQIIGPVLARSSAHFGAGARFEGDLDSPAVQVEDDVVWVGVARVGG